MSLVSDALKKAQREAARREAEAKGLPEPLVAASQPYRARRASRARTALLTVVALALLGAVSLLVLRLARPAAGPGGAAATVEAPPPAAKLDSAQAWSEKDPQKGVVGPAPAPASATPPPAAGAPAGTTSAGATARPGPGTRAETTDPPSVAGESSPVAGDLSGATSAPAPPAPEAQPGERSFVREALLEDGVEIRLGGIAWSEVAPLAYLNGRLAGVGESVSGYRIEAIDRDRVRLSGPGGRIVLSLR